MDRRRAVRPAARARTAPYGGLGTLAALAPTDAALGAAVMSNPLVPQRVRRALNVESGPNDGIATPVVRLAFTGVAASPWRSLPKVGVSCGQLNHPLMGNARYSYGRQFGLDNCRTHRARKAFRWTTPTLMSWLVSTGSWSNFWQQVHRRAVLEPGSCAAVLLWENLWAAPSASAVRHS